MHECAQTNAWVHVNICMSTRKQIHECMRISMDACEYIIFMHLNIMHANMYGCMWIYIYIINAWAFAKIHEYVWIYAWVRANKYMSACEYVWMHVNIYTYDKCMSACKNIHEEYVWIYAWVRANKDMNACE